MQSLAQDTSSMLEWTCPIEKNNFRGLSALNSKSAWFSSDNGQVWYFHVDSGWRDCSPSNYPDRVIMWRDIHAYDENTALILSAGSPALILRTSNGGSTWEEVYRDDHPEIFFDAFDFYGGTGRAFSDALEKQIGLIETKDSGKTWNAWEDSKMALEVAEKQGGFAASGTCLRMLDEDLGYIVLGGEDALFKKIGQETSLSVSLPLDKGERTKGAFSIDFKNEDTLIAVGGDYRADSLSRNSVALSYDGGSTWRLASQWPQLQHSYWSCVSWEDLQIVLCSRFKTAVSKDNGKTWSLLEKGYYTFNKGWFAGQDGRIARFKASSGLGTR